MCRVVAMLAEGLTDMFKFKLPKGAVIDILGKCYVHEGDGVFSSYEANDRPHLIEVIVDKPLLDSTVILQHSEDECYSYRVMYRVAYTCLTEDELPK